MPVLPKLPQKDESKELPSLVPGGNLIAPPGSSMDDATPSW